MTFLPLHHDVEHKFKNGNWTWAENEVKLKFHPHGVDKQTKSKDCGLLDAGLKFAENINVAEEKILRELFLRSNKFYDSEVVTLQDIKNLVFFSLKSKASRKLIELLNKETYDKFLHDVIFYIDFFLLVLEFLLIRRDKEARGKIRDTYSIQVERQLSKRLSDRRLLIARDYATVCQKALLIFFSLINWQIVGSLSDPVDVQQSIRSVSFETVAWKGFAFFRIDHWFHNPVHFYCDA